jgi:fructose-1,6-bisphosphatase/inositol monophosphatase family enzyme
VLIFKIEQTQKKARQRMDYPDIDYLNDLASEAGEIILDNFGNGRVDWKKDKTPVTPADKIANELVVDRISRDFPNISIIGEERSLIVENSDYTVYCDPIDGTFPFVWNMPVVSFCIAVVAGNTPISGVIHDPFLDRMWFAEKGKGSFLEGEAISVSARNSLEGSSVCICWWKDAEYNLHEVCAKLMKQGVNWFNPASIAYLGGLLAMGKIDATIFPGSKFWETAAMQVITEEAGGKVTDIFGKEIDYSSGKMQGHIISNGRIHDELVDLVQSCQ